MLPPSTAYSPTPIRATTPIRGAKETRLQLFLYPFSLLRRRPFLFASRSFLHGLPRCYHPVHPSLSPQPLQNLPRTQPLSSPFHLSRSSDEQRVYGIMRDKAKFICIPEKRIYIYIYRCCKSSRSAILRAHWRLYPKISSFIDERIHSVANVLYFSGATSSAHES